MKRIQLKKRPVDNRKLQRTQASEKDTELEYSKPGIYCLSDEPVIIYGQLREEHTRKMRMAIRNYPFNPEIRSAHVDRFGGKADGGKKSGLGESQIFGFRPRIPFGANYCSVASAAISNPNEHKTICEFGQVLDKLYAKAVPEIAKRHQEDLKSKVLPNWIIPGTRFTSGIVNQNNSLRYHFDRGNLEKVMSCMVVFRQLCSGGFLSIPEFNARWLLEDNSYFFFDGQSYLHGVTPINKWNKNGYRYSVVYYALRAMGKCGTPEQELKMCREEKRRREKRRVTSDETSSS